MKSPWEIDLSRFFFLCRGNKAHRFSLQIDYRLASTRRPLCASKPSGAGFPPAELCNLVRPHGKPPVSFSQ